MIAALFVADYGPYIKRDGIDPWTEARDARNYDGPHRVIAHPPCERWGRYWSGGPSVAKRKHLGDDKGCFWAALSAVRQYGGVLEHPEASHAFKMFGLPVPEWQGGWTAADMYGGRSCCIAQGNYGHPARKLTWLYGVGIDFRELDWSIPKGTRLDEGFHSKEERDAARARGQAPIKRLSKIENVRTPDPFAKLLIGLVSAGEGDTSK